MNYSHESAYFYYIKIHALICVLLCIYVDSICLATIGAVFLAQLRLRIFYLKGAFDFDTAMNKEH